MSAIVGNQNLLSLSYRQELKEIEAAFGNTSTTRELARLLSSENPSESLEEGKFEFLNAEEQAFLKELMASMSSILFFIFYLLSVSIYFLSTIFYPTINPAYSAVYKFLKTSSCLTSYLSSAHAD